MTQDVIDFFQIQQQENLFTTVSKGGWSKDFPELLINFFKQLSTIVEDSDTPIKMTLKEFSGPYFYKVLKLQARE